MNIEFNMWIVVIVIWFIVIVELMVYSKIKNDTKKIEIDLLEPRIGVSIL